jgi:hypothetical protein
VWARGAVPSMANPHIIYKNKLEDIYIVTYNIRTMSEEQHLLCLLSEKILEARISEARLMGENAMQLPPVHLLYYRGREGLSTKH